ncbi:Ig-like domain-containing protein [uncultured Algibacter sp.]|uniref:Ig-like domain-containing protein n=1 Tax=uncultured Algibacter sp. TaxID=298659 RepID=UPI002614CF85|nr:Ig-like domain-containing protein [uncultured Algibacter sp.]
MKHLHLNPKVLTIIMFFLLFLPSCNNEELFVIEESAIVAEEPEPAEPTEEEEEDPNSEDVVPAIDLVDDNVSTLQHVPVDIEAYLNDTNLPESITLTNTNPSNGVLSVNNNDTEDNLLDDTVVYTPNSGFSGIDSFEYTVCDATNAENCDSATVTITIEPIEDDISTELKAFPTAFGAGANSTGGRGGKVCHVNTLEWNPPGEAVYDSTTDTYSGGFYDLFYGLNIPAKQIVFDVAGTIVVGGPVGGVPSSHVALTMTGKGNITISGQTAPGKIVFKTNFWWLQNMQNVIFRYVSFASTGVGWSRLNNLNEVDALWIRSSAGGTTENIMIDHCSFFYGTDECLDVSATGAGAVINNVTVQNCLMGGAKKGAMLGSKDGISNNTFCYSAFVDCNYRYPNLIGNGNSRQDVYNNFIENPNQRLIRTTGNGNFNIQNNYIAYNYYSGAIYNRMQYQGDGVNDNGSLLWSSGNIVTKGYHESPTSPDFDDLWDIFASSSLPAGDPIPNIVKASSPMSLVGRAGTIHGAAAVPSEILPYVGNNKRLGADGSVINESYEVDKFYLDLAINPVSAGTSNRYPSIKFPEPTSNTPYVDTDKDGMPDDWETNNGYNPVVNDSAEDRDGDGYTNLEEFLNIVDK